MDVTTKWRLAMGISMQLDEVMKTQDGPWVCYDATVTGEELLTLYQTGFLKLDADRQRGKDTVTGKLVLDQKKVDRWTQELIAGTAILGQLSWNFRKGETEVQYTEAERKLKVVAGAATIPDSFHRCRAIVEAAESYKRGSTFDPKRKFSVRIYHVTKEEENRIFYAMNQEGQPADPGRSKWLHPKEPAQRLAAELVRNTPELADNVDSVRDRLSKRNWRVAAFGTISKAVEDAWTSVRLDRDDVFSDSLSWLQSFWREVVKVLPELGKLDLQERQQVRKASLVDSANAIYALFHVARRMKDTGYPIETLARLADFIDVNGTPMPFLSRANPEWQKLGVLVPGERVENDGSRTLALRNSRQARNAFVAAMLHKVGLGKEAEAAA
jgi:hypothetical protein